MTITVELTEAQQARADALIILAQNQDTLTPDEVSVLLAVLLPGWSPAGRAAVLQDINDDLGHAEAFDRVSSYDDLIELDDEPCAFDGWDWAAQDRARVFRESAAWVAQSSVLAADGAA